MRGWRDEARVKLRKRVPPKPGDATLADDVTRYFQGSVGVQFPTTRKTELQAWVAKFGTRKRAELSALDLDRCLLTWREKGVAESTCNHRRNALIQLWWALDGRADADGRETPNPAKLTTHFREPSGEPHELPTADLDDLIAVMPASKTRAFFRLFVETGWPPARIRRLREAQIRWAAPAGAYLEDRRKGRVTAGRFFPVTARGLEALRAFHAAGGYGGVTRASLKIVFDRARARVNAARAAAKKPPIAATVKPYHARHTIGAQVFRRTGDIAGAAEFLGVTIQTALRYTRAAVPDRMRVAAAALDDIRGPSVPEPAVPPVSTKGRRRRPVRRPRLSGR
jgi:integrase